MGETFCGNCGTVAGGGGFCGSCGSKLPVAGSSGDTNPPVDATIVRPITTTPAPAANTPPSVPPAPAAAGSPAGPPPVPPAPVAAPTSAEGPAVSKPRVTGERAAGASMPEISVPDVIRDGLALLALFMVLGVYWGGGYDGGDRWWVLISVLLSVGSLSLPYLRRGNLLGPLGAREAQLIKWGLNVPALVSIVVAIIDGLIHADEYGGLSSGVVLLSGGVALAMQPRFGEPETAQVSGLWEQIGRGAALAGLAVAVITTLRWLIFDDGVSDSAAYLIYSLLLAATGCAVFGIAAFQSFKRAFSGVAVMIAVGAAILTAELLATMGDGINSGASPFSGPFFTATSFMAVAAAIYASRPVLARVERTHSAAEWVGVARLALGVAAIGCVTRVVMLVVVQSGASWHGSLIATMILVAVVGAACVVSTTMLQADPGQGRKTAVLVLVVALVVSVVALAVGGSSDLSTVLALSWIDVAVLLALPGLAVAALAIPRPVREAFGPLYTPPADPGSGVAA